MEVLGLGARRPDPRRRGRRRGRAGARDRRASSLAGARATPARRARRRGARREARRRRAPTSATSTAADAEERPRRGHGEERRDEQQPRRVRAAVDERDHAEHAPEHLVGHLLLRGRVEQHVREALGRAGADGGGDGERQRPGDREQRGTRAGRSPRRACSPAPCGGPGCAPARRRRAIEPTAKPIITTEKPPAPSWSAAGRASARRRSSSRS